MTDGHSTDTGQISVAELLARNGQKVNSRAGGRRRRGVSGGISVAELTGEIPVSIPEPEPTEPPETKAPEAPEAEAPVAEPAVSAPPAAPKAESLVPAKAEPVVPAKAEPVVPAKPKVGPVVPAQAQPVVPAKAGPVVPATPKVEPLALEAPKVEPETQVPPSPPRTREEPAAAERVQPVKVESPTEIIRPAVLPRRARAHAEVTASAPARPADAPEPRLLSGPASDLRGNGDDTADGDTETIGEPVAADEPDEEKPEERSARSRRRRGTAAPAETPAAAEPDEAPSDTGEPRGAIGQWVRLIGEGVVAIIAGALLFKGFEQLWDALPWVAFALALLVIVGLVAMVRILRRTDDITSQLIALAVGAFVTFGPLLFLLPTG
ncbi:MULTISPECIES: hypothetical protein [Rhodococcus]|uniref:hypothetical protein n=1 Tax=Rhodococcus TaxID=1827 RepID=UPI000622D15B|nr:MULTISPECIES: hypothetical protein [Rhodococcus]AKE91043.1 hypothetical protein AAT18_19360 [Rhodococcus aetherivorans]MBC2588733.1 hypothetical protein [Rhodococcus aetherivorans]QRI78256.1 hypothetical protein JQ505_11295 [Rhodococcus aetherivorans]QSE61670.1 hypothetical protein JYA75_12405 [Rhodococcus sp. PSBB066]QSE67021.1 hypothetical protein JYA91_15185 [Rhodococcus sp. PSBB049]